jgi:hypothetical protein
LFFLFTFSLILHVPSLFFLFSILLHVFLSFFQRYTYPLFLYHQ